MAVIVLREGAFVGFHHDNDFQFLLKNILELQLPLQQKIILLMSIVYFLFVRTTLAKKGTSAIKLGPNGTTA